MRYAIIFCLLAGCAAIAPVVKTIGKDLFVQAAGAALEELAREKGVKIDKLGAVCFEAPSVDVNLPQFDNVELIGITCVAAHLEE